MTITSDDIYDLLRQGENISIEMILMKTLFVAIVKYSIQPIRIMHIRTLITKSSFIGWEAMTMIGTKK